MKVCYVCKRELPLDAFLTITVKDKRCKPGHSWTGPSADCRECRNERKREGRRKKAEAAGRKLRAKGEWQAEQMAASLGGGKEKRRRSRQVAWALCLAFRALVRLSPEEKTRRYVERSRERYNADPDYRARIDAKKIRRKRAQKGTQVVPVNRLAVAVRDRWLCGICGKRVTRATWSIDHIVPLSKGGPHTYANVQLAHRRCNASKGDKMPVRIPDNIRASAGMR